jgi:uncharacterized protein YdeI (YjbR/CyaY-like superfamily)
MATITKKRVQKLIARNFRDRKLGDEKATLEYLKWLQEFKTEVTRNSAQSLFERRTKLQILTSEEIDLRMDEISSVKQQTNEALRASKRLKDLHTERGEAETEEEVRELDQKIQNAQADVERTKQIDEQGQKRKVDMEKEIKLSDDMKATLEAKAGLMMAFVAATTEGQNKNLITAAEAKHPMSSCSQLMMVLESMANKYSVGEKGARSQIDDQVKAIGMATTAAEFAEVNSQLELFRLAELECIKRYGGAEAMDDDELIKCSTDRIHRGDTSLQSVVAYVDRITVEEALKGSGHQADENESAATKKLSWEDYLEAIDRITGNSQSRFVLSEDGGGKGSGMAALAASSSSSSSNSSSSSSGGVGAGGASSNWMGSGGGAGAGRVVTDCGYHLAGIDCPWEQFKGSCKFDHKHNLKGSKPQTKNAMEQKAKEQRKQFNLRGSGGTGAGAGAGAGADRDGKRKAGAEASGHRDKKLQANAASREEGTEDEGQKSSAIPRTPETGQTKKRVDTPGGVKAKELRGCQ